MVDELNELWDQGFKYKGVDDTQNETHHAALLCCACDVPAARKVCGFLSHNAKAGCSKCKKEFKTGKFGENTNYGAFSYCELRNDQQHRQIAGETVKQPTMTKRMELEKKHGVRYTELMRLPYYDSVAFCVIDPMQNLFLGTAKHMFKTIWADKLDSTALSQIQKTVDGMIVPTSIGRIPQKIQSSFSSFTADQWKNWTLYFSPVALKDWLPHKDYDCWMLFSEACRILISPNITAHELAKGHNIILNFCRTFEKLYGAQAVTPNMHLHVHIVQCILDYGPIHVFWLFAFERMNGILGSFHTNQWSAEMQIMRKLLSTQTVLALEKPTVFADIFLPAFSFEETAFEKTKPADVALRLKTLSSCPVRRENTWLLDDGVTFIGARSHGSFQGDVVQYLKYSISLLYDTDRDTVTGSCYTYTSIDMCGEVYGSSESRMSRSSLILASWCGLDGTVNKTGNNMRPGIVRFYITFFIVIGGKPKYITMAYVNWLQKVAYGHTCPAVGIWCHRLYEPDGPATFMPVQIIYAKCICAKVKINNEELLAVIPHIRQLFW